MVAPLHEVRERRREIVFGYVGFVRHCYRVVNVQSSAGARCKESAGRLAGRTLQRPYLHYL